LEGLLGRDETTEELPRKELNTRKKCLYSVRDRKGFNERRQRGAETMTLDVDFGTTGTEREMME
jgi:hypothetical protein